MQLLTNKNFTIVRQLSDPSTSGTTYYVRAVVRNAYTDAILATLNMADKGSLSQRFTVPWTVPADPSGEGFYVSIITSVYSDPGYTTKSADYGEEENTYLVADRQVLRAGGFSGGGNGGGLSRRDVRDVFQEEFAKIAESIKPEKPQNIEFPEQKEYDGRFDDVIKAVNGLKESIKPAEKIKLEPITKALVEIKRLAESIKSGMPKLDLSPVLDALKEKGENDELTAAEMKDIISNLENSLVGMIKTCVGDAIKNTNFVTSFITHAASGKENTTQNKESQVIPPEDLSKLTG